MCRSLLCMSGLEAAEVAELNDENIEVVDLAGLSASSVEYLHASPDRPGDGCRAD